jgi:hypothetical protein
VELGGEVGGEGVVCDGASTPAQVAVGLTHVHPGLEDQLPAGALVAHEEEGAQVRSVPGSQVILRGADPPEHSSHLSFQTQRGCQAWF